MQTERQPLKSLLHRYPDITASLFAMAAVHQLVGTVSKNEVQCCNRCDKIRKGKSIQPIQEKEAERMTEDQVIQKLRSDIEDLRKALKAETDKVASATSKFDLLLETSKKHIEWADQSIAELNRVINRMSAWTMNTIKDNNRFSAQEKNELLETFAKQMPMRVA